MYRIPSPITMGNASASLVALTRAIDAAPAGTPFEVALDALAHSDSSAVAVLLAAVRHAAGGGRTLRLSGTPPSVDSLARLYGVAELLHGPTATPASVFPAA